MPLEVALQLRDSQHMFWGQLLSQWGLFRQQLGDIGEKESHHERWKSCRGTQNSRLHFLNLLKGRAALLFFARGFRKSWMEGSLITQDWSLSELSVQAVLAVMSIGNATSLVLFGWLAEACLQSVRITLNIYLTLVCWCVVSSSQRTARKDRYGRAMVMRNLLLLTFAAALFMQGSRNLWRKVSGMLTFAPPSLWFAPTSQTIAASFWCCFFGGCWLDSHQFSTSNPAYSCNVDIEWLRSWIANNAKHRTLELTLCARFLIGQLRN